MAKGHGPRPDMPDARRYAGQEYTTCQTPDMHSLAWPERRSRAGTERHLGQHGIWWHPYAPLWRQKPLGQGIFQIARARAFRNAIDDVTGCKICYSP